MGQPDRCPHRKVEQIAAQQQRARRGHADMGGPDRPLQSFRVIAEIDTFGLKWTVLKTALEKEFIHVLQTVS
jgi:hypothetical protein